MKTEPCARPANEPQIEAIVVPVSGVDRAKKFYQETLGFRLDVDHHATTYEAGLGFRQRGAASYHIVQLTPPGLECSIQIGTEIIRGTLKRRARTCWIAMKRAAAKVTSA